MGFFFSNFHVLITDERSKEHLIAALSELFGKKGFVPVENEADADISVSIFDGGENWLSVCSDEFEFFDPDAAKDILEPISDRLNTFVLGVSCFDSDCLLMNLINLGLGIDAWARVGNLPGLGIRSTPAKWKPIVSDFNLFNDVLKKEFLFAEEALDELEPLLGLARLQGRFCFELSSEDEYSGAMQTLYYSLPEAASLSEPPKLTVASYPLDPCKMGESCAVSAMNLGGKSVGLEIAFSGSYVEHDEIVFRDVRLEYGFGKEAWSAVSLDLKKEERAGRWLYCAELPDFSIPAKVNEHLPQLAAFQKQLELQFTLRFTPEGNARKSLDIAVHFIPLADYSGQCGWCCWYQHESKKAYIEATNYNKSEHLELLRKHSAPQHAIDSVKLLDPKDYDLDD